LLAGIYFRNSVDAARQRTLRCALHEFLVNYAS